MLELTSDRATKPTFLPNRSAISPRQMAEDVVRRLFHECAMFDDVRLTLAWATRKPK